MTGSDDRAIPAKGIETFLLITSSLDGGWVLYYLLKVNNLIGFGL
jgi:hypothetical protein